MKRTKHLDAKLGIALCTMLLGHASHGQPSVTAEVSVSMPSVEIRAESDFYEPLTQYGRWEVVGTYGRCWLPGRVEANWRPYCDGHWQRTDAGWYWVSEEPWGWATYHYGRWDFSAQVGWYWMPQTQWAPAWVSWHEGGGYVGWAPLQPSARISGGGSVTVNVALIAPRAYVFVEQRRFLEPIRPTTVVVNNTTIINKTVDITNIKVVNNTVVNEGPRTQVIEKASGQKVQAMPVRELRSKAEAPVAARQRGNPKAGEATSKNVPVPIRNEVDAQKSVVVPSPAPVAKPSVPPPTPGALTPTGRNPEIEKATPAPAPAPTQVAPRRETPPPAAIEEKPKASKFAEPTERPAGKPEQKAPGKPVAPGKGKPAGKPGKPAGEEGPGHKPDEKPAGHPTP
jgi:hypothetical protein